MEYSVLDVQDLLEENGYYIVDGPRGFQVGLYPDTSTAEVWIDNIDYESASIDFVGVFADMLTGKNGDLDGLMAELKRGVGPYRAVDVEFIADEMIEVTFATIDIDRLDRNLDRNGNITQGWVYYCAHDITEQIAIFNERMNGIAKRYNIWFSEIPGRPL